MGVFHDCQLVSLDKFYKSAVGILYICEVTACLTHVEMGVVLTTVNSEREAQGIAVALQGTHIGDIETDLDESWVAPETSFINLAWGTVQRLNKLYGALSERGTKAPFRLDDEVKSTRR